MEINKIKEIASYNKKKIIIYLIVFIVIIIGVISVYNNYSWYTRDIAKIEEVTNSFKVTKSGTHGEKENYYNQEIKAIIKNGDYNDEEIRLNNTYSSSRVYDDKYEQGDDIFLSVKENKDGTLRGSINGFKRDKYIAIIVGFLFMVLIIVANKRGVLTFISLCINTVIFLYAINLYIHGEDILFISNILVFCFTVISMLLTSGFNKKTLSAIVSTLISVTIVMIIFKIVVHFSDGIDYSAFEYVLNPDDLHKIFTLQLMIGGLGAIMDVSISMAASMGELIVKDNNISVKKLIKSGREIGYDIMGTMINVLLFTYICGAIPIIIFKMKNGFNMISYLTLHMPFEIYRFLIGSIGILISIPIAQFISVLLLKKGSKKI